MKQKLGNFVDAAAREAEEIARKLKKRRRKRRLTWLRIAQMMGDE